MVVVVHVPYLPFRVGWCSQYSMQVDQTKYLCLSIIYCIIGGISKRKGSMETKYFIINNKTSKADNQEQAGALLYELNNGGMIESAVAAGESVHYVIGTMLDIHADLSDEDAAVIRDNLDTTHVDKR